MSSHGKACLCTTCTCGHHHCPPGRAHAGETVEDAPFNGGTEYEERFKSHRVNHVIVKPVRPPAGPSIPLESHTENKDQYVKHDLPERHKKRENKYIPNPAPFDNNTIYRDTYKNWPTPQRPQKLVQAWKPNGEHLDGMTTSKNDYQVWPVKKHEGRKKQPYVPNPNKFETISTSKDQYRAWEVQKPVQRPPQKAEIVNEDRDFKTASSSAYKHHDMPPRKLRAKEVWQPSSIRFEGESIAHSEYQTWALPKKEPLPKPVSNDPVPSGKFEGHSVYQDAYLQRAIPQRYHHQQLKYTPNPDKFEGVSSSRSDYVVPNMIRTQSFKPKLVYARTIESRDFATESAAMYDAKQVAPCRLVELRNVKRTQDKSGHIILHLDAITPSATVSS